MKTRLLGALVGFAISFALPTYAQQKDVADPQTTQKILAMAKTGNDAHNNNDAAAIAEQFTRDGECPLECARLVLAPVVQDLPNSNLRLTAS